MLPNLETSLLNVRKAYRLIFDFQSRILNLASFIGNTCNYTYKGGWQLFSDNNSPRDGRGLLSQSAWDWLNMYYYQFYFGKRYIDNKEVEFAVNLLSDSGWYESSRLMNDPNLPTSDLDKFRQPEHSQTKLILIAGIGDVWRHHWQNLNFVLSNEGKITDDDKNGIIIFKSYRLEHFATEENTLVTLQDFNDYCAESNIPFEISIKKF